MTTEIQLDITTDNRPRTLTAWIALPESVQREFDYIKAEEEWDERFVQYRDAWYDVSDTQVISTKAPRKMGWEMCVPPEHPFAKWDRIVTETFFSGVIFRLTEEGVICGRYAC